MIDVHLAQGTVFPWRTAGPLRTRGEGAFEHGGLPCQATGAFDPTAWAECLRTTAGSFAVVAQDGNAVTAVVDRCRSFPIFYGTRGPDLYVSDDARWVRDRVGDRSIDPAARAEALICGFVSGADTLVPSVKQVQAGEMVRAVVSEGEVSLAKWRWDSPDVGNGRSDADYRDLSDGDRLDQLDTVLRGVADRLFESLHGRLLVIPLSGGHDSRLITLLAKTSGYDRVLCLGSQRRGHWEAEVGRVVAERLGLDWVHFAWSPCEWYKNFGLEERRRFYRQADGLSALPALVEWPALVELRRSHRIPDDAIIAPGHFGGFVTGASTPQAAVPRSEALVDAAVREVIRRRYTLNRRPNERSQVGRALRARLRDTIRSAADGAHMLDGIINRWEWREYQAKQVGICVRAYELLGFEWRLPFADPALIRFWQSASRSERQGSELHHRYVTKKGRPWNLPQANPGVVAPERSLPRRLARRLGVLGYARRIKRVARRLDGRGITRDDGLGWSGLFEPADVRRTYTGMEGVQSYLAREWLEQSL